MPLHIQTTPRSIIQHTSHEPALPNRFLFIVKSLLVEYKIFKYTNIIIYIGFHLENS